MVETLKLLYRRYRHFILYGIIGGTCASLDFLLTVLLNEVGVNSLIANIIGVLSGITLSFFLNAFYNFKKTDKLCQRAIKFYTVGILGLFLSLLILIIGDNVLGYQKAVEFFGVKLGHKEIEGLGFDWNFAIVKILSIFVVALFQFFLNKFITFKQLTDE